MYFFSKRDSDSAHETFLQLVMKLIFEGAIAILNFEFQTRNFGFFNEHFLKKSPFLKIGHQLPEAVARAVVVGFMQNLYHMKAQT